jgi:hypothetical protein
MGATPTMTDPADLTPVGVVTEQRLTLGGAIEIRHPATAPTKTGVIEVLGVLSPIVSGVVVALVAYFLTGSVTAALQREELQLSNVTEMRDLLLRLEGPKDEEWRAAAFTLSAFGAPAVTPLVTALATADQVRAPIIESALRGIGLTHPDAVCAPMTTVIDNRTGRFSYAMHHAAIRLIGDLACTAAAPALERYEAIVKRAVEGDLNEYSALVDAATPPSPLAVAVIQEDVTRTTGILAARER